MHIDRIVAVTGLVVAGALTGCSEPTAGPTAAEAVQGPRSASGVVVVDVGRPGTGTDYFPPGSHDASYHAQDRIRPRTTVISPGTTVSTCGCRWAPLVTAASK